MKIFITNIEVYFLLKLFFKAPISIDTISSYYALSSYAEF